MFFHIILREEGELSIIPDFNNSTIPVTFAMRT